MGQHTAEEHINRLAGNVILIFKEHMRTENLSISEASRRMGMSAALLGKILKGGTNFTVSTAGRMLHEAHFYPRLVPIEPSKGKGVE